MKSNHVFLVFALSFITIFPLLSNAGNDQETYLRNPVNWAHPRGQFNNQGYTALSQVNLKNANNLKLAWSFATGVNRGHQGSPLVIDGVMYLHTAFPNNVYALDLNQDQKLLWTYFPKQAPNVQAIMCCDNVNRGLGFGDGKILLQQNDGTLVALDGKTGQVQWQVQVNNPANGASNTNAPQVIKDKVLTGCSGGEFGVRCFIAAYALKNGELLWKAFSTGSDEDVLIGEQFNLENLQYSALSVYEDLNGGNKPGGSFKPISIDKLKIGQNQLGIRTWIKPQQEKDGWQNGGGAVNGYFAFDPKTNLIYYGTGNPGVWNPDVRPGDNKWANTVFARDIDTGIARWAMQTTPHDEWSYDATNEIILFEYGKETYATQANKNGFLYTWQAKNGSLILAKKVHPFVDWATTVDLRTGVPSKDASYSTHLDINTKGICPSVRGMNPASYSPKTKLLYAPLFHMCMTYEPGHARYIPGQPWQGATITQFAGPDGMMGAVAAFDPMNGKTKWYNKEKYLATSGILSTAGNLVFYNAGDRWFKAVDGTNGKEIWRFQIGSPSMGNPFSYQHLGKQYIGILSGIGIYNSGCDKAEVACKWFDEGISAAYGPAASNYAYAGMLSVFKL